VLAGGLLPGASGRAVPFAKPHLAGLDSARSELLRAQHGRLFTAARCVVLNTAVGSADAHAQRLVELAR